MQKWKELLAKFKSPISRLENYMMKNGILNEKDTKQFRQEA